MELNYDGTRDREGFASYIHLNETLFGKCFTNLQSYFNKITYFLLIIIFYITFSIIIFSESQRRDGYRFTDHFKDLRLAFTRAKNKTYKGKSMAKKMREDENGQE
ncbi:hypothetical protein M5D96_010820 [Drosophila gunungcola]|uniref:Uncharacterized protein n=1 Tax=Drosophila gunungcola TaxID=103775 RepID=A0A9P9YG89_9MUSC|nr:hypothetical protein M5D96_010812 [Drosophila gunungcola]KAI8036408.1 hypothetical protein M5D96_010820 [Drosophila gunungcola]